MKKYEYCVLIKHYFLGKKTVKEIKEMLAKYYRKSFLSHGIVHKWFIEFRCDRTSTNGAERPKRLKEVTS